MWLLLAGLALAELPPPDYRDVLNASAADEVTRRARATGVADAMAFAKAWERQVGPDARVRYEVGLALRLAGRDREAAWWLDASLDLDPELVAGRYDRGELRLTAGDLAAAREDFEVVARVAPERWPGHFRLAEVAARRADADAFERHLLDALRTGFSVRTVVGDARWRGYLRHPELGPVLRRLVVAYQDEAVLDALESSENPP